MACSSECCILNPEELTNCPNFLLCKSLESKEVLDETNGLCLYCFIMNGKLEFKEDTKCIICLENNKIGVCFDIKCDHHICVDCHKKKYLVDDEDDKNNIFKVCAICQDPDAQKQDQDSLAK